MSRDSGELAAEAAREGQPSSGMRSICPHNDDAAVRQPAVEAIAAEQRSRFVLSVWLGVAVALWLVIYMFSRDAPFQETHAWVSAHFSTIARSFAEHGLWQLRFVPVQNNDPMGVSPDFYTHWPPLFPALLSVLFTILGESTAVVRGFMLTILLANTGALMWLTRIVGNTVAALVAGLCMLCSPVIEQFALIGLPMHLAILGMLLGVLGFVKALQGEHVRRGWATFGVVALMLGCMASWEPVLATPGLFLVALIERRRAAIVLSIAFGCAAALTVVIVLGNYVAQLPDLAADLWDTMLVRINVREYPTENIDIHFIVNREEYASYARPSAIELMDTFGRRALLLVGRLGLIALIWAAIAGWIRRRDAKDFSAAYAVAGLFASWALWYVLMNNHAYVHEFMVALLVPASSVATGLFAASVHRLIAESPVSEPLRRSVLATLFAVAPALLVLSLVREAIVRRVPEPAGPLVRYAQEIEAHTEPGAIVLSHSPSMVPVFYSRRHVIRAVGRDEIVDEVLAQLPDEFPGAPAYLAIEPHFADRFTNSVSAHEVVVDDSNLILIRLRVEPADNLVQAE